MSVEENSSQKYSPNENSPEDGTKPLNDVDTQQAKFVANPNGDAKIDIGNVPAFAGLTKEELMKYSTDPFWVKLRWTLFILFWLGWIAMLVVAIIIIVGAPACEPPPSLLWIEEAPIVELDPSNLPSADDLIVKVEDLGISSVYLPNLIQEDDFKLYSYDAEAQVSALNGKDKQIVTDLPTRVLSSNPFFTNASKNEILLDDGTFDYSNKMLPSIFAESILANWIAKGVKGFIMDDTDSIEKINFKEELNNILEEKSGAIGSNVEDLVIKEAFSASTLMNSLEQKSGNWTFTRYKASHEASSVTTNDELRLMTIALFLSEGTPILLDALSLESNSTSALISELTKLRKMDGIKFGETNFVSSNGTNNAFGFTRVYKGFPAFAVALNFKDGEEVISFKGTPNIAEDGNVELISMADGSVNTELNNKLNLFAVDLGPKEGKIIQFVGDFS